MFWKKDNLWLGLGLGIALPIIIGAFIMIILEQTIKMGSGPNSADPVIRARTVYLLGICANLLLVNYYKKLRFDLSLRGVAIGTSILGILWMVRYGHEIMNQF